MVNVLIYTTSLCPYCARAKNLLDEKGINFHEIDVDFEPGKREEMIAKTGGRRTVPQIFIAEHHVGGCDDLMALERTGKLGELLTK